MVSYKLFSIWIAPLGARRRINGPPPGERVGIAAKRIERAVRLDEHLLRPVFGIVMVSRQVQRQAAHPLFVAAPQRRKGQRRGIVRDARCGCRRAKKGARKARRGSIARSLHPTRARGGGVTSEGTWRRGVKGGDARRRCATCPTKHAPRNTPATRPKAPRCHRR